MDAYCFPRVLKALLIMIINSACTNQNKVPISFNCTCNFECDDTGYMEIPLQYIGVYYRKYSRFDTYMKCPVGWAVGGADISLEVVSENILESSYSPQTKCYHRRINAGMAIPVYEKYYNVHFVNEKCFEVNRLCQNTGMPKHIIRWDIQIDPTCFMNAIGRMKDKDHNAYLNAVVSDRDCDIQFLPPKLVYLGVCPNESEGNDFKGIKDACRQIVQSRRYANMEQFRDASYLCKLCAWLFNDTSLCFKPHMQTQIVLHGLVVPDSEFEQRQDNDCISNDCFKELCKENEMGKDGNCIQPVKYLSGRILSTQVILLYPVDKTIVKELLMQIVDTMPEEYQTEVVVKVRKVESKCWRITFEFSVLFYIEYKMVGTWTRHLTRVMTENVTHDGRARTVYNNDRRKDPCIADDDFNLLMFPFTLLFGYACLSFTFVTFVIRLFWELRMENSENNRPTNVESNNEM